MFQYGPKENKLRQKIINIAPVEDIISYECNYPGKFIKILVGVGNDDGKGNFMPTPDQSYEVITLYDEDFDALMAATETKPKNVFRKEDLWPFVDSLRPIVAAEKLNGRVR